MTRNTSIAFRCTTELKRLVDQAADKDERKASDWVRRLVEKELENK